MGMLADGVDPDDETFDAWLSSRVEEDAVLHSILSRSRSSTGFEYESVFSKARSPGEGHGIVTGQDDVSGTNWAQRSGPRCERVLWRLEWWASTGSG